jgi:hypothetical protein
LYLIINPLQINQDYNPNEIKKKYPGIKKVENISSYSSDLVDKISKDELKMKIQKSGLINGSNL